MKQRFSFPLFSWLVAVVVCALLLTPQSGRAAEGIEIVQANLESSEDGFRLAANFRMELSGELEDALRHGITLHFTTDVEITRPRWYWFDETAITTSQTIRLSYNVLTRRYNAGVIGNMQQNFESLSDAMSLIRRPSRWVVAQRDELKTGATYDVKVRTRFNRQYLAKPFQINSLSNRDWRLASDWKNFSFKVE